MFQALFRIRLRWTLLCLLLTGLANAQTGQRQMGPADMPIRVLYPTTQANQTLRSGPFEVEAAPDAPPLPGTRLLIVLSHGTAGSALADHALAATLVRAGFVVAQPQHRGDNFRDFSQAGPSSWQSRPHDVSETIDAVARDAVLGPLLRTDRVGVHGMSAGGITGLALAGAQWRLLDLVRHCDQHLDEDIGFCLHGLAQHPVQQQLRRAQYTLTRHIPEQHLPSAMRTPHGGRDTGDDPRPDPRVAAVSLLVPLGAIFTPESLARIRIPVGLTVAEADEVLVPLFHSQHVLRHCTTCTVLSSHAGTGHFDWLWPWPESVARQVANTQMRGGLPHAACTPTQRQSAFTHIATFFQQQLGTP
jgi:predicted dienelactone hydrolase